MTMLARITEVCTSVSGRYNRYDHNRGG